jgi:hypothetical protein
VRPSLPGGRKALRIRERPVLSQGVSQPESVAAAYSQIQRGLRPVLAAPQNKGDFRVRVQHTEYVQDINGSVAFAIQLLSINPGLASLFPWLANIASCFESYEFRKLCFHFRTEAGSQTAGKVMTAVDWDSSDAAPASKVQLMQNRTRADGACWQSFDMPCDAADLKKFGPQRYVRTGAVPAGADVKTYDVGNFLIATQGEGNSNAVGELHVSYDVDLITPAEAAQSGLNYSEFIAAGGTVSVAAPLGSSPTVSGTPVAVPSGGNTLTFPQGGSFIVTLSFYGTTFSAAQNVVLSAGSTIIGGFAANSATLSLQEVYVMMLPGGTLTIVPPSSATTVTNSTARLASYNAG